MSRSSFPLLIVMLASAPAFAQEKPAEVRGAPVPLPVLSRPVTVPAASRAVDEELLAVARAGGVNVMIDASQMPAEALASPQRSTSLRGVLNGVAKERKMTWLQNGAGTFLFWSEPDFVALARSVANEVSKAEPKPPQPTAPVPPFPAAPALQEQLSRYLASPATGQGTVPGTWKDVPVAALPPALRQDVMAAAREAILGPQGLASSAVWFSDEFWNRARLRVRNLGTMSVSVDRKPVKTPAQWLFVGGVFSTANGRKSSIWRSLGPVPVVAPATAPVVP